MSEQLTFLASLDFPGRSTLDPHEVAERLGYSAKHIRRLIEDGEFEFLDGRSKAAGKPSYKIPIECYRNFLLKRLTEGARSALLLTLPRATLRELHAEIGRVLKEHAP